jgi:hypothetical protein
LQIDQIVLGENLLLRQAEWWKRLLEDARRAVHFPFFKTLACGVVHGVSEALQ